MTDVTHKIIWRTVGTGIHIANRIMYPLKKNNGKIIRFNTAEKTDNLGDYIIMRYCSNVLDEFYNNYEFIDVPTHTIPTKEQEDIVKHTKLKFICGTNILTSHIERHWNWCLPDGLYKKLNYRDVILLGAGWKNYERTCSEYSKMIYKSILCPNVLHSVRDCFTEDMLKKAGITNVINTGCPTMWQLTPEFCRSIPLKKAQDVVTTITDYRQDIKKDNQMLKILSRNYDHVYLWLQGKYDEEYLKILDVPHNLEIIPPQLEAYEERLVAGKIDYVGTRLHAGIFALNHRVRSIVIAVDNRAIEISKDTNLPTILRDDISVALENCILSEWKTDIHINQENINLFKAQFRG